MTKQIQIGVIGSSGDKLTKTNRDIAIEVGKEIAKTNSILLFGFEDDVNSLSQIAAESAEIYGGKTIRFVRNSKKIWTPKLTGIEIVTGQNRGGGREFPFILSCDAIICIGGGSGTLMEVAIAYQAGIPVLVIKQSGGWSTKLSEKYLDNRRRFKILSYNKAEEIVRKAVNLAQKYAKL